MNRDRDRFHESGLAAQVDDIRNTIDRFDEATLAAAESIRDAEVRLGEATLTQADAEAIWDAACAVAPHAPGIITMLSNLEGLPERMQSALPELVNDTNIAAIANALRFIDKELNNYFADSDTGHLANALDTGLEHLHQALEHSFGYWQMGQDPAAWPPVAADLDLRPERRDPLAGKLLAALSPDSAATYLGGPCCGRGSFWPRSVPWVSGQLSREGKPVQLWVAGHGTFSRRRRPCHRRAPHPARPSSPVRRGCPRPHG